jgi:hypothetical protein
VVLFLGSEYGGASLFDLAIVCFIVELGGYGS